MMAANGLAKLIEELGELQQVAGKMMAYGTGPHPDGTESLLARFEEEAADVLAAVWFCVHTHNASGPTILSRSRTKEAKYHAWHNNPEN